MAGRMSRAEAAQYKAYLQEQRHAANNITPTDLPPGAPKPAAHQSLAYMKHLMSESDSEVDEPGTNNNSSSGSGRITLKHDSHNSPAALQHQVTSSPGSAHRHLSSHATTSAISPTVSHIQSPNSNSAPQMAVLTSSNDPTTPPPASPRPHRPQRLSSSRNFNNHQHAQWPHSHTPNPHSPDNSSIDEKGRYHGLTLAPVDIDCIKTCKCGTDYMSLLSTALTFAANASSVA